MNQGPDRRRFNARDGEGRQTAPGVYFWRLESESTTLTRKAIKID